MKLMLFGGFIVKPAVVSAVLVSILSGCVSTNYASVSPSEGSEITLIDKHLMNQLWVRPKMVFTFYQIGENCSVDKKGRVVLTSNENSKSIIVPGNTYHYMHAEFYFSSLNSENYSFFYVEKGKKYVLDTSRQTIDLVEIGARNTSKPVDVYSWLSQTLLPGTRPLALPTKIPKRAESCENGKGKF